MKKIALYMRVSTNLQSINIQENDLERYCSQRDFIIYKKYIDQISGAKQSRPSLNQLMNDARKRKFDIVLVWRFDRFARSTKHLNLALEEFESLGIDFISYQENIDTSSPLGRAMFSIIGAMAQLERDIIKERVNAGIANAKKKGKKLGRPKRRNDELIRHLHSQGMSYRKISKELKISVSSIQASLKVTIV